MTLQYRLSREETEYELSRMSTSANILQLKYKKIVLSDLTFDQGDSVSLEFRNF